MREQRLSSGTLCRLSGSACAPRHRWCQGCVAALRANVPGPVRLCAWRHPRDDVTHRHDALPRRQGSLAPKLLTGRRFQRWAAYQDVLPPRVASYPRLSASRSEEHTSELQSLMRISYAVFCLKKKILKVKHRVD